MSFFSGITDFLSGGVGSVVGGLISGVGSLFGGQATNASNQQIAASTQAFQADQSATAYQRAVKDMEAAGLNPMLAYSQGGATTPTGAMLAMQNPYAPAFNTAAQVMQAGSGVRSTSADVEQKSNQNDLIQSQVDNTDAQTALNKALVAKAAADTTASLASAKAASATADKTSSGSLMSDIFGSDLAKKASNFINSSVDAATNHSASSVSNGPVIWKGPFGITLRHTQ